MTFWRCAGLLACLATASPLAALDISAPANAVETARRRDPAGPFGVAIGPAAAFEAPPERQLTAPRLRIAWRAGAPAGALMADLQQQLAAQGFVPLFECAADSCGGFDFRLSRSVLPMPDMFVDLGGFTYLALARPAAADGGEALASILASAGADGSFAQLTLLAPQAATAASADAPPTAPAPPDGSPTDLAARLQSQGRVVLGGLAFQSGGLETGADAPPALAALADFLKADPARRIALVGHGDWTGSAEANLRLTRARAAAVAEMLTGTLGVAPAQIDIHGAGYLAPRRSNETEAGRAANRRVEAVLRPPAR